MAAMNKMNLFRNFSEFDEFLCRLFDDKQDVFSDTSYKGVPLLQALQHNVFDVYRSHAFSGKSQSSWLNKQFTRIRTYGYDHRVKWIMNRWLGTSPAALSKNRVVFFADNYVPRILEDFLKIMSKMKPGEVAFHTTDIRALRYMRKKKQHREWELALIKPVKGKETDRRNRSELLARIRSGHLQPWYGQLDAFSATMKSIVEANIPMLIDHIEAFLYYIDQTQPGNIVLGSDGFSVARAVCFAARIKKVNSITLQHGLLGTLNGYLPLVSDRIIVWSSVERDFFIKRGVDPSRIWQLGSPRFDKAETAVEAEERSPVKKLLYVLSPGTPDEVVAQLDMLLQHSQLPGRSFEITIRPHPYYWRIAVEYLKQQKNKDGFDIDSQDFQASLVRSDIVVFADVSTGVFESLIHNKPTFVLKRENNGRLPIYDLPFVEADAFFSQIAEGIDQVAKYDLRFSVDVDQHYGSETPASRKIAEKISKQEAAVLE